MWPAHSWEKKPLRKTSFEENGEEKTGSRLAPQLITVSIWIGVHSWVLCHASKEGVSSVDQDSKIIAGVGNVYVKACSF